MGSDLLHFSSEGSPQKRMSCTIVVHLFACTRKIKFSVRK